MSDSEFTPDTIGVVPPEVGQTNRGYDNRITETDAPQISITLEKINDVIMDYFTNVIKPVIDDNGTSRPVPIMYGTPERWKTVRQDGFMRDPASSKILTPLIMLRRTKEAFSDQMNNPSNKYLYSSMGAGWNARNAYDQFAVRNHIRPSQQYRMVVIPDYLDLSYEMMIWTEYQEQLDGLIQQISFESQEFWGNRNNWKFRVTIPEFSTQTQLPAEGDRVVRSEANMIVKAYLLPEKMVKNFRTASTDMKAYTAKKLVIITETVGTIQK